MLANIQQQDPVIKHGVTYSNFVVAYWLHQDQPNPGWRKANIEGPVYLVRRRSAPRYQLLVKNQFSTDDLIDSVHQEWELDCQKNYVFYKVEQANERIRGLWFHDDSERQVLEQALEKVLVELRNPQAQAPPAQPPAGAVAGQQHAAGAPAPGGAAATQAKAQPAAAKPADDKVMVTTASLQQALHALADDEGFLKMLMQKLQDKAPPKQVQ